MATKSKVELKKTRPVRIDLHALNVVLMPHSPEAYASLFRKTYLRRAITKVYGDRSGIITELRSYRTAGGNVRAFAGTISTFLNLNPNEPWLNVVENREAERSELQQLKIPESLKPSMRRYEFYFDVATHCLVVQSNNRGGNLAPRSSSRFFIEQFTPVAASELGNAHDVAVTVIPDDSSLRTILALKTIKSITMVVTRPNPDDHRSQEKKIEDRLKRMNAHTHVEEFKATSGGFVELDEEAKVLARVAARNGRVVARAVQHERVVPLATTRKPFSRVVEVNEGVQSVPIAFLETAQEVVSTLAASDKKD